MRRCCYIALLVVTVLLLASACAGREQFVPTVEGVAYIDEQLTVDPNVKTVACGRDDDASEKMKKNDCSSKRSEEEAAQKKIASEVTDKASAATADAMNNMESISPDAAAQKDNAVKQLTKQVIQLREELDTLKVAVNGQG